MQAAILIAMSRVHSPFAYISVCAIFGAMWLGVNPFQVSLLVDLDKTRQAALLLASLQLIGFGTGPLICSFFVSPGNMTNPRSEPIPSPTHWSFRTASASTIKPTGKTGDRKSSNCLKQICTAAFQTWPAQSRQLRTHRRGPSRAGGKAIRKQILVT